MRRLAPNDLEVGMITTEPVVTPSGQTLSPKGTAVTRQLINRMKLYRVPYATVEGDDTADRPADEDFLFCSGKD